MAFGANVEENVARRGDGMAAAGANLPKRMKLGRAWRSEELVPGIGPESGDARKAGLYVAKLHRANQPGETRAKVAQARCKRLRPGRMHSTRKIADRVSGPTTVCGRTISLSSPGVSIVFFNPDLLWLSSEYRIFSELRARGRGERVSAFVRGA